MRDQPLRDLDWTSGPVASSHEAPLDAQVSAHGRAQPAVVVPAPVSVPGVRGPAVLAYSSDKLSDVKRSCPQPSGDVTCDQVSGATFVTMGPATKAAGGGGSDSGGSGLMIVLIVLAALIVIGVVFVLVRRRRAGREAVELER